MRKRLYNSLIIMVLSIVAIAILFPIGIMLYTSVQGSATLGGAPGQTENNFIDNYKKVLSEKHLLRFFINTIVISTTVTLITLLIGSLASFGFSKLRFRFRNGIFTTLLLGIMLPAGTTLLPLFIIMKKLHLINNLLSVILIHIGLFLPFAILILKNSIDNVPGEILDAGYIDGCNNLYLFYRVVIPLTIPSLTAVGIFTFLWSWNNYLLPLIFLRKPEWQTVQMAPQFYFSHFYADLPLYFASMVVIVMPVIILYFILQNKFIEGLTAGALKE